MTGRHQEATTPAKNDRVPARDAATASEPQKVPGFVPDKTTDYLQPSYWDQRFESEQQYDWFKDFSQFSKLVLPSLNRSGRILVLGCGNSSMTADLWRKGFHHITSIDLSEVAISKMARQAKLAGMDSLEWRVADMLALPFADQSFDAVVEKGTMDVLFVDNDSPWNPNQEVCTRVHQMLAETHRVLTPQGVFISITFAQPHFRKPFFHAPAYSWAMRHAAFGTTFHYFVYTLRKGSRAAEGADEEPLAVDVGRRYSQEPRVHEHMDDENYLACIDL